MKLMQAQAEENRLKSKAENDEWKKKFGDEAWTLLEQASGKLA